MSIVPIFTNLFNGNHDNTSYQTTTQPEDAPTQQAPDAKLIIKFYDESGNFVESKEQAITSRAASEWENLRRNLVASQNGEVEVTIVNNDTSIPVYFDNLKIQVLGDEKPLVLQENHYYPFGMNMKGIENEPENYHKFQYNGKEKQTELGLNWADYGARNYQADLGRWFGIDPLAEKYYEYSPYNYVLNNPLKYIDPDGRVVKNGDQDDDDNETEGAGIHTPFVLFGNLISGKYNDDIAEFYDNTVSSTKFEAKVTFGAQIGQGVALLGIKESTSINLGSFHIFSIEHEQQKSETGPTKTEITSIFDGDEETKMEQSIEFAAGVVAVGAERSFIGNTDDGGSRDEKVKFSGGIGPVFVESEETLKTGESSQRAGVNILELKAALLLGIEIKISTGVSNDKIE